MSPSDYVRRLKQVRSYTSSGPRWLQRLATCLIYYEWPQACIRGCFLIFCDTNISDIFNFVTIRCFQVRMALLEVHADAHVVLDGFPNPSMLIPRQDPTNDLALLRSICRPCFLVFNKSLSQIVSRTFIPNPLKSHE